jgi:hypothetical protein
LENNLKVNNFAVLEKLEDFSFQKVVYYSVRFLDNENEITEFYDFLNRMEDIPQIESDLGNLIIWLEEIGDYYGAIKNRFFRHEAKSGEAMALPPSKRTMEFHEIVVRKSLRLYCLVANEHVVFLFNGGIKTTLNPEQCPEVGKYFKQANLLARKIDRLFQERSIIWNQDMTDIDFDSTMIIEL